MAASVGCIVSFGYRHILRRPVLDACRRPPLNLHISFLPFNRGSHPNFWSFYDGTPKGVTIHEIDEGLDTGAIVLQREVCTLSTTSTWSETYERLREEIEALFKENWTALIEGHFKPRPQVTNGTSHRARDLPQWSGGWTATIEQTLAELKKNIPRQVV